MSPAPSDPLACHENLECLLSASRQRMVHVVADSAPALPIYAASLPEERLLRVHPTRRIRPYLNDWPLMRCSEMGQALRRAGVSGFVPSYRASPRMERWAREHGLQLLSPPSQVQRRLEDKIQFHRFLQRHRLPAPAGFELRSPGQLGQVSGYPLVCQLPHSEGMEGTFLVTSKRQLQRRLAEKKLRLPLLCRERVEGPALGITVVVGERDLLLSAVRLQCRGLRSAERDLGGVQWLPRVELSSRQRRSVAGAAVATGKALQQSGYRGVANLDLILDGDRALIIECNPRFSSSTPQLSLEPSLLHGLDLITEYCRALRGQRLGGHLPRLPDTSYQGTHVDLSPELLRQMRALRRRVAGAMPVMGVHDIGGGLRFVSHDVGELAGPDRALFYYSTPAGQHVGSRSDLGSLMTGVPLFAPRGRRMMLNRLGERLVAALCEQIRFKRPRASLAELVARASATPPATG